MFCYQCEQTAFGTGCEKIGVCGKTPEVAALQDMLIYETIQLGRIGHALDEEGRHDEKLSRFIMDALFTTVTNVNFDPASVEDFVRRALAEIGRVRGSVGGKVKTDGLDPGSSPDRAAMLAMAEGHSPKADIEKYGPDLGGLKWMAIYGLKGTSAYVHHAMVQGVFDEDVNKFFNKALAEIGSEDITVDKMLSLVLEIGAVNLKVMENLDRVNTENYGNPEPTSVRVTHVKGKAILVSGHDLPDLEKILRQTEGKGINVYTHGEMLPCNAYPKLKKYPHLAGNWGGAWQNQTREFPDFPGAIVMTTNCIQNPTKYMDNIFTSGLVQWPGVKHIANGDFTPAIEKALAMPGFRDDEPEKRITIGFAHKAVLDAAGKVVDMVKSGKIRHFYLIGGCDGAKPGRNYYTEFAEEAPKDTVILTLACGKYRFNKLDLGEIDGLPRVLDCGQCNDAYSAIRIASALADAFKTDVNGLPLSLIISWYEQKAVCVLLTLLHLGIKKIRLGPSLPAFVGPEVLKVLVDKFELTPIGDAKSDLAATLA